MSKIDKLVGDLIATGVLTKAEKARERHAADKAKKAAKRAERQQLRLAAQAERWDDREGKARPTPQRRLKGVFRLRDGDEAGVAVAVDEVVSVVDCLAAGGLITQRQREAGHIFEDVARGGMGSPTGKSCIDFSPVGHDEAETEAEAQAARRWDSLRRMMRLADRQECLAVCWSGERPRCLVSLRRGLDATADWAGLE